MAIVDDSKSCRGSINQLIKGLKNFEGIGLSYINTSKLTLKEIEKKVSNLKLGEDILIFIVLINLLKLFLKIPLFLLLELIQELNLDF